MGNIKSSLVPFVPSADFVSAIIIISKATHGDCKSGPFKFTAKYPIIGNQPTPPIEKELRLPPDKSGLGASGARAVADSCHFSDDFHFHFHLAGASRYCNPKFNTDPIEYL